MQLITYLYFGLIFLANCYVNFTDYVLHIEKQILLFDKTKHPASPRVKLEEHEREIIMKARKSENYILVKKHFYIFTKHKHLLKLFPGDISCVVWIHFFKSVNNPVLLVLRTDGSSSTAAEASPRPELLPLSQSLAGCLLFSPLALTTRLLLQLWQVAPVHQVVLHREVEEVFLVDEAISVAECQR